MTSQKSPYFAKEQIRAIWNAASFSIQEFGAPMNVAFSLNSPRPLKSASCSFVHRLEQRLRYWSPQDCRFVPWIAVQTRTEQFGFQSAIILHVPHPLLARLELWLEQHRKRRSEDIEYSARLPKNGQQPLRLHLESLRLACLATDPAIWVRSDGQSRALLDIVSPSPRSSQRFVAVPGRRIEIAPCISQSGQGAAKKDGMSMISAFDDGEFAALKTGWELAEHGDRIAERNDRRRATALVMQKWPVGENELYDQIRADALGELKNQEPRKWRRSWTPWWLSRTGSGPKSNTISINEAGSVEGQINQLSENKDFSDDDFGEAPFTKAANGE